MKNKPLATIMTACLLTIAVSGSSLDQLQTYSRPYLAVSGATRPDLSTELISFTHDSSLNRLEFTLNNWDVSAGGYKHSDSGLFLPGVSISMFFTGSNSQQARLFDGTVTSMAPHFNAYSPSTITVIAAGKPQNPKTNTIQLSYGQALRQFDPVLGPANVITCAGITNGNPEIQVGTSVAVTGVGQRYSLTYQVTKVVHTFDGTKGYITQFTATTRLENSVPPLMPNRRPAS